MSMGKQPKSNRTMLQIEKTPTGIKGLDEIMFGGIPKRRSTLICGGPGCGKSLLAIEILLHGASRYGEPGVMVAFEESREDLIKNASSLGFDLEDLIQQKKIFIEYIEVTTPASFESGEYNLEGLFIRLENAITTVKAKRIVMDTIEVLFGGFPENLIRSEIKRLIVWLKSKNLTIIFTGEKGRTPTLTRYGIEEYVADCVIYLDQRTIDEIAVRRLQVIKYRGSSHGSNEYPFVITEKGLSIFPITSLLIDFKVSNRILSTGVNGLNQLLGKKGYYEGSSILITGTAGAGKSFFCASFAADLCKNKCRCLYLSNEESPQQIVRNMLSMGIDLSKPIQQGYLKIISTRPAHWGLETHFNFLMTSVEEFKPEAVIIDPISSLLHIGSELQVHSIILLIIDFLKGRMILSICSYLSKSEEVKMSKYSISSLIDTWIALKSHEVNGGLTRKLVIIKSRGMEHSLQPIEYEFYNQGVQFQIKPIKKMKEASNGPNKQSGVRKTFKKSLARKNGKKI